MHVSFLVLICFLVRGYTRLPKKELHESPGINKGILASFGGTLSLFGGSWVLLAAT